MRRGIKIRYDKSKAEQDLAQKYGGQGEVVGKKFGLRKAYYAVPKKGFKKDTKPTITITKKEMDKFVPPSSPVSIMNVHQIVYFDKVSSEQEKRAKLTRKISKYNIRVQQRRIRGQRRLRAFHAYQ